MTIGSLTLGEVIQWAIFPLVGALWWLAKDMSRIDKEVVRLLAKMEAREGQRDEDRADNREAIRELHAAINMLTDKIDKLGKMP